MVEDRIPTGIDGLDHLIGGGFPRGSLILLAGNPGTGKTVFGSQFIVRGASENGEKGVYVSFVETKETLIQNISRHFGMRAEDWREDRCKVLDFSTMRETGIPETMNIILSTVQEMGAKRLVIDSFSAMAQAFKEPIDARIILHTILGRMIRRLGCTTILIVEAPIGREDMGTGVEEFVADGVLILRRKEIERRFFRELEIAKLRGVEIEKHKYLFTLHKGFRCFPPSQYRRIPLEERRIAPVYKDETPRTVSTGIEELDRLLDGGWSKGSFNLLEVEEGVGESYGWLTTPLILSSVNMGRSAYMVLSGGISSTLTSTGLSKQCVAGSEERLKISINVNGDPSERSDYLFEINRSSSDAFERYLNLRQQLKEKSKDGILVESIGSDTLEYDYGPDLMIHHTNIVAKLAKESSDVHIHILKKGQDVSRMVTHLADTHWKFKRLHGAILFYGVVPETGLYVMESDSSKGYRESKITPIV